MFEKLLSKASPTGFFVALDLETSGIDKDKDKIIEIGCVKFDSYHKKIERISYLINPSLQISDFIKYAPGISSTKDVSTPITFP